MIYALRNSDAEPPLRRLSRALVGDPPAPPLTTTRLASLAQPPQNPPSASKISPPAPVAHVRQPHEARLLTAALPGGGFKTQSAAAWARELDMSPATLRYRLHKGWSDMEALGFVERARDRAQEQSRSAAIHSNVLVVEDIIINNTPTRRIIPRPEAARRLGIQQRSLVQRLRQYRSPTGSQVQVSLLELAARSKNQGELEV